MSIDQTSWVVFCTELAGGPWWTAIAILKEVGCEIFTSVYCKQQLQVITSLLLIRMLASRPRWTGLLCVILLSTMCRGTLWIVWKERCLFVVWLTAVLLLCCGCKFFPLYFLFVSWWSRCSQGGCPRRAKIAKVAPGGCCWKWFSRHSNLGESQCAVVDWANMRISSNNLRQVFATQEFAGFFR